jgi:glycosyltransferase involved in cell wall biosynthesis
MKLPDIGQELLVVDNCPSNDEAFHIVKRHSRVRYVCEDRPGLNIARNRALREARQEIVAFTDEGAIPDPSWLNALVSNFDEPSVLCVTGLTMPLELETEAQEWFERYNSFGRCFRRTVLAIPGANPMAAGRFGAGTNMALRRSVLEQIGPFEEALDAGTPTRSGGDADMFSRILTAGYKIIYDPSALNWYRNRKTREALRQALYDHGVGVASCWTRHLLKGEWGVLKVAWNWLFSYRLKAIARSALRRSNSIPMDLLSAELRGCAIGPWAYCYSRILSRGRTKDHD